MLANVFAMCVGAIAPVEYFTVDVYGQGFLQTHNHIVQAIHSQFPPECARFLKPENFSCSKVGPSSFSSICYFETKHFGSFYAKLDFMNELRVMRLRWD